MISSRRGFGAWGLVSLVGALAGVVGCAADAGTGAVEAAGESAEAVESDSPVGAAGRRGPPGHPGGPEMLLFAALHELELSDAQRATVKGALEELRAGHQRGGPHDGAPFAALAEGVRAGKIDEAAVLAKFGAPERPAAEHAAALAKALDTLHATLSKEQRRELVDGIAARMDEHGPKGMAGKEGREGKGGRRGGHGPDGHGHGGPGDDHMGPGGPLGHLLGELDLTDAQRTRIEQALAAQRPTVDREAMKKGFEAHHAEMRARLESFASDSFDAKTVVAPPPGAQDMGPRQHLERMVKDFAVIVGVLEPAQREKLAALLEKGPPGPMGGPEAGRRGPPR